MPPWQGGGDMIESVSFEKTTFAPLPNKFEAGTPHISGATGLAAAIDYVTKLGIGNIAAHEHALLEEATARLKQIPGVRIYGEAKNKAAILSFLIDGAHPHDVGTIFDHSGVAVRAGHHCAQPIMERYGIPRHRPGLVRPLQHPRGRQRAGQGRRQGQGDLRMSSELRELYQEVILDHGRSPRNFRVPEHPTHHAHGHNPLCGDTVTVYLEVDGDTVKDAAFEGQGCAISMASTSLMTEILKGRPVEEAHALFRRFPTTC